MAYNKKKGRSKAAVDKQAEMKALLDGMDDEILSMWKSMYDEENQGRWIKPWLMKVVGAEDFGRFCFDERYQMKGHLNPWLIAWETRDRDDETARLIVTEGNLKKIYGVDSLRETPIVGRKDEEGNYIAGVKTAVQIFRPSQMTFWNDAHGKRWFPPKGEKRQPTADEIELQGLSRVKGKLTYQPYKVWSVADVYDRLPDSYQEKVKELVETRKGIGLTVNMDDDFHAKIKQCADELIERQGIKVDQMGNQAVYIPRYDRIRVPPLEQNRSAVEYLANIAHEVAHSTMPMAERNPYCTMIPQLSAIEEVIAETTAQMYLRKVYEDFEPLIAQGRDDIQQEFDDFFKNSARYLRSWSNHKAMDDFGSIIESLAKDEAADGRDPFIVRDIMRQVLKAYDMMANQSFTPEQRLEANDKNMKNKKWAEIVKVELAGMKKPEQAAARDEPTL